MPVVSAYPQGVSMYTPSPTVPRPGKRGEVKGWSPTAAARHVKWLQSVDSSQLTGYGYAVTLTVKDVPENAMRWAQLRKAWLDRMRRAGMIRVHWVTEWQRRGAPHLHAAVYFEGELTAAQRLGLVRAWLEVASEFGAQIWGQRVERLRDAAAWGRYCAKHSARSSSHVQRKGMPPGWEKSGRLWGQGGDWPTKQQSFAIDMRAFHELRRLMRAWRLADARQEAEPRVRARRIASARRCLKRSERGSAVWGMREWVPEATTLRMVEWLIEQGHEVHAIDAVQAVESAQVGEARLVAVS